MPNTRTVYMHTGRSICGLASGISVLMMKVLRDLPEKVVLPIAFSGWLCYNINKCPIFTREKGDNLIYEKTRT